MYYNRWLDCGGNFSRESGAAPPLHASDLRPHQRDSFLSRNYRFMKRVLSSLTGGSPLLRVFPAVIVRVNTATGIYGEDGGGDAAVPLKLKAPENPSVCRRQAERLLRFSQRARRAAVPPPRRPWAAACENWKTRRTAAPGRSTPP